MSILNNNQVEFPYTFMWVFPLVMQDPNICRQFLERLFPDRRIKELTVRGSFDRITPEKAISVSAAGRAVRLDVVFEGDDAIYDIEMQMQNYPNLPRRTRYYHSMMDASYLRHSDDFSDLKPQYVIFICPFDPFGQGEAIYDFKMIFEKTGLKLNDQSYTIFLNTKSSEELIPFGFENFFRYVNGDDVDDSDVFIREIHEQVVEINCNPEWRDALMTFRDEIRIIYENDFKEAAEKAKIVGLAEGRAEGIAEGRSEGRAEGIAEGRAEGRAEILLKLVRSGKLSYEDALEVSDDPEAFKVIYMAAKE